MDLYTFGSNKLDTNDLEELKYEAYDRIRKNYLYMGDLKSAQSALEIAENAAQKNDLNSAIVLLSKAELNFVKDPQTAFNDWRDAQEKIDNCDNERIKLTYELIKIQEQILKKEEVIKVESTLDDKPTTQEKTILGELERLHLKSIELNIVGPLPKIHLLNGLFHFNKKQYSESIAEFEKAHNQAEKYAYGVFMWLSLNNMAIANWVSGNKAAALKAFKTAIEKATKQGFIDYLATSNILFFQNALVYNCQKFSEQCEIPAFELETERLDIQTNEHISPDVADDIFKFENYGYLMTFI